MPSIRTKKFAAVVAASAGDNQIVANVANQRIIVVSYVLVAVGAVSVKWRSAANDLSGAMPLAANGGLVVPAGDEFAALLETNLGEALNLNLSGAVAVGGHISYVTSAQG